MKRENPTPRTLWITIQVELNDPELVWDEATVAQTEDGAGQKLWDFTGSEIILNYCGREVIDFDFDTAAEYVIEQQEWANQ